MNDRTRVKVFCLAVLVLTLTISGAFRDVKAGFGQGAAWKISDLGWIAGDWQTAAGGRAVSEEHWIRAAGGSMMGLSRTLAGDRIVSYEFLRIEERGEAIYYVASPQGKCPPTDFKLTRLSGQEAIFENPEHDFPKRIIYRRNSDGGLTAIVDGGEGTRSQTFAFKMMTK
jgi:Domain of unknown function (DUF6265)